jgi:thiol-disulfide isomerase/thioredoxin
VPLAERHRVWLGKPDLPPTTDNGLLAVPPRRLLMSQASHSLACFRSTSKARWMLLAVGLPLIAALAWLLMSRDGARPASAQGPDAPPRRRIEAPELDGGIAWLNTAGPLRLKDLRGKIVLLDFWTLCCINCIHTLPDLARLEKKYPNELVVIGVHTAKFDNEKNTESIRKAILRYEVSHPVLNDAEQRVWRAYGSQSWPTLCLIDPEGYLVARGSGEGLYDALDERIAELIKIHKKKKTLNNQPLKFQLARVQENGDSPLFFPGKVLADAASKRLFIADSTHHRIVITDLDGKKIAVAGDGQAGKNDGPFAKARFNDPQGMALKGELLYVADRKNHLLRVLDLKARMVKTVAGTDSQGQDRDMGGPALKTGLNSPWDLLLHKDRLFVAMAGHHQIWVMDLAKNTIVPYAGDGRENIRDGTLLTSRFAQPSGLATDGKTLWVADSEVSAVRAVPLDGDGEVKTLVGEGLFEFGDVDGQGRKARLQHALGLAFHDGKLYLADTYNSKIKRLDPATRTCATFLGSEPEGWLATPLFSEPGGISYADGKLYVADTNAHRIRVIDLKTKTVATLKLQGVEAPAMKK